MGKPRSRLTWVTRGWLPRLCLRSFSRKYRALAHPSCLLPSTSWTRSGSEGVSGQGLPASFISGSKSFVALRIKRKEKGLLGTGNFWNSLSIKKTCDMPSKERRW